MIYTSANRDERVFRDPQGFDIHRDPNPHLSFGTGEHFCLGVHLARLEGRVFFEELLDAFPTIEQTGPARAPALEPQQRAEVAPGAPLRPRSRSAGSTSLSMKAARSKARWSWTSPTCSTLISRSAKRHFPAARSKRSR